jgi:nucleotide-binding universal stress UspA family protein
MPLMPGCSERDSNVMSALNTLVVGVDGSVSSEAAMSWAAEHIASNGSIHVVHARSQRPAWIRTARGRANCSATESQLALATTLCAPAKRQASTTTHVIDGAAPNGILAVANSFAADAIVVGPHSSRYTRTILGSVTRRLLHRSSLPVIIPNSSMPTTPSPKRSSSGSVVACIGYGEATEAAAFWAADFASVRGYTLTVLHVVGYRPIPIVDPPTEVLASYLGRDVLEEWANEVSFPFLPRYLSLVGAITIGIPGFVLSFIPADEPCQPGYLSRVLRFSIPAGVVAATATFAAFWAVKSPLGNGDLVQARTAATITLTVTGLWVLYRLSRPLDRLKAGLIAFLTAILILSMIPSPWSDFYALRLPPQRTTAVLMAALAGTIIFLESVLALRDWRIGRNDHDRIDE